MQQSVASQGGKLESIMSIGAMLPDVEALRKKCHSSRANLDGSLGNLRSTISSITVAQEQAAKHDAAQEKYADLIKQRQEERATAERRIDERTESRIKAQEQAAAAKQQPAPAITTALKQQSGETQTVAVRSQSGDAAVVTPPHAQTPRDGSRPAYPPRPQYGSSSTRTYTPSGQQQHPSYGGAQSYPPRDPNRTYPPRDPNRPYPPRDPNRL